MTLTTKKPTKPKKSDPLTPHEEWVFSQTQIAQQHKNLTNLQKRNAIQREGLENLTKTEARKRQIAHWNSFKQRPENKGLPSWLIARRMLDLTSWHGYGWEKPIVKAGERLFRPELAKMAHDRTNWGRDRKHTIGRALSTQAKTRIVYYGRYSWRGSKVKSRHADYVSVLSPDGTKLAIQLTPQDQLQVVSYWRGLFKLDGKICRVDESKIPLKTQPDWPRERVVAKRLQRAGFDARVAIQTTDMISSGSGATLKSKSAGSLVCVVPDGLGSWYHVTWWETTERVIDNIQKRQQARRIEERNAQLDKLIGEHGRRIWVGIADSLSMGNCEPGTLAFADKFKKHLGVEAEIGGATVTAILGFERTDFTLNACRAATLRFMQRHVNTDWKQVRRMELKRRAELMRRVPRRSIGRLKNLDFS